MRQHFSGKEDVLAFHLMFTPSPPRSDASFREFETYRWSLAYGLDHGRALSPENSKWLAAYLRNDVTPPGRPQGRPPRSFRRAIAISDCVEQLTGQGFKASRNDDKADGAGNHSACDAVAKAMLNLGQPPWSYDEIKKIYFGLKRSAGEWAKEEALADIRLGLGAKTQD